MREFYIYGFKHRDEYTKKSARSYDDEKRRMESLLGDWMRFRQTPDGKNVFLSIDSRVCRHNPFYKAWKAKSFTDGDITLHFILMDVLASSPGGITLSRLAGKVYDILPENAKLFDDSTIRKKLKEYVQEGIVRAEKKGKTVVYYPVQITDTEPLCDLLDFFSETAPCGVIGSFLLDKTGEDNGVFAFKHHYITGAIDSEIVCLLFEAMGEKRYVSLKSAGRRGNRQTETVAVPLRIMISAQNGRQYLMAYIPAVNRIMPLRTDRIISVKADGICEDFDKYRKQLEEISAHIWGVSTQGSSGDRMEHVEFTVKYGDDEKHIAQRLQREKRCGTVEHTDNNTSRFSADVFDSAELIPWIRTFICRITDIRFSNEALQKQFFDDLNEMYAAYGIEEGGEDDAVQ